jgi:cell fate regulator YaaT (PSP1 superfamily)
MRILKASNQKSKIQNASLEVFYLTALIQFLRSNYAFIFSFNRENNLNYFTKIYYDSFIIGIAFKLFALRGEVKGHD